MNNLKTIIRYVAILVFFCFVPAFAYAQSLHVDVPDVSKDNANKSLSKAVRTALTETGYTVSDESEMKAAAKKAGLPEDYWKSEDKIVQMNKKNHHDALIVIELHPNKKPYMATKVYDASTGKVLDEFKTKLQKKTRLSKAEKSSFVEHTNKALKNVKSSGKSESSYQSDSSSSSSSSSSKSTDSSASTTEQESTSSGEKLKNGAGRPIFMIAANVSPAFRSFNFSDETNLPMSYKTIGYPVIGAELSFFPFPLFSTNDYLGGLGIQFGFGIARPGLDTKFRYKKDAQFDTKCTKGDDNIYTCKTTNLKIHADLVYRLMLQKEEGKLNPNGMALDFLFGFNMMQHKIDDNPSYNGNDYYGFRVGLGFSTPLGIDKVRLSLNAAFVGNLNKEAESRTKLLGKKRDLSMGANAGLDFLFDVYKGFFLHAGYDMLFIHSKYNDTGCNNSECTRPKNASINDMYHEIVFGLGYMYY